MTNDDTEKGFKGREGACFDLRERASLRLLALAGSLVIKTSGCVLIIKHFALASSSRAKNNKSKYC
jgi:hypothetical protein